MGSISTELRGQSVLVTGGAGFIGSHLVDRLSGGCDVTVLDWADPSDAGFEADDVRYVQGDIRDTDTLERVVADVDIIFHQAALVSVPDSIESPEKSQSINGTGTMNVLEAARRHDSRVVFASSAAIYGHPERFPIKETHPTTPASPYGVDKLAGDHYARVYNEIYGLETVVLRYFNVYGPRQTGGSYAGVISAFIRQALSGEPITVHGDGEQTRDFVFVDDVVNCNLAAAETSETGEAYNVGTGTSISIRELAERIHEVTDTASDIVHTEPRDGDIDRSIADIEKCAEMLEYEAEVSLDRGLEQTIQWFSQVR